ERMGHRVVRLEPLANSRPAVAADSAHGTDTTAFDRHPRASRCPRAQITEVGETGPYSLDRRDELIADRHRRHRAPPSFRTRTPAHHAHLAERGRRRLEAYN